MLMDEYARPRFQSTLPVWGATFCCFQYATIRCDFNPRSPCGERPKPYEVISVNDVISIHAPRVGGDEKAQAGEEPIPVFQSTLPVWGATALGGHRQADGQISIHAPRVGSDT